MTDKAPEKTATKRSFLSYFFEGIHQVFRFLLKAVRMVFLLLLVVYILFQIPSVRAWSLRKITEKLSSELKTEVRADRFSLEFLDKIILKGLYIEDQAGDTLLYAGKFKADINLSPLNLFKGRLLFDQVVLENATVHILREKGAEKNNLQFILDYFNPPGKVQDPTAKTEPPNIAFEEILLQKVHFINEDYVKGQRMDAYITESEIEIKEMDLRKKNMVFSLAAFEKIRFNIDILERQNRSSVTTATGEMPEIVLSKDGDTLAPAVFKFLVEKLRIRDADFEMHNYKMQPVPVIKPNVINFNHLSVSDIDIRINDLAWQEWTFTGIVEKIAARERSGFQLDQLSAQQAALSRKGLDLYDVRLLTPFSDIGDTLRMKYNGFTDFQDFENEVKMEGRFHNSKVAIRDIMFFAPNLENSPFFRQNRNEVISVDGLIKGEVNDLSGNNLVIQHGEKTYVNGSFNSTNLVVKGQQFFNLKLNELRTDMKTLRAILPGFNAAPQFDKLGIIQFTGRFDWILSDYIFYGQFNTDLGEATMDMKLNLAGGLEKATYNGHLELTEFNLSKWLDNPDFGNISLTTDVKNGKGLSKKHLESELSADVHSLSYKNYTYKNAHLEGKLNNNLIDGKLQLSDENIDFQFDGKIDFASDIPVFDFHVLLNKLALQRLNLTKKNLIVSGDFDMKAAGKDLAGMEGKIKARELHILRNNKDDIYVDSITVVSEITDGFKRFSVLSDILTVEMTGIFNLNELPSAFTQYALKNHPSFSEDIGITNTKPAVSPHVLDYEIHIIDTRDLTAIIDTALKPLRDVWMEGYFDNLADSFYIDLAFDTFQYKNIGLYGNALNIQSKGHEADIRAEVYQPVFNNKTKLYPLSLLALVEYDTVQFGLTALDFSKKLNAAEINGNFYTDQGNYLVTFDTSNMVLLNESWKVDGNNFLAFGKNGVRTHRFELHNGDRKIAINSRNNNGLVAVLSNFDIELLNSFVKINKLTPSGRINTITASVDNLFKMSGLNATVQMDTLFLNYDDWGGLSINFAAKNINEVFKGNVALTKGKQQLLAQISLFPVKSKSGETGKIIAPRFEADVDIASFPVDMIRYFIETGISETEGEVDANITLKGDLKRPDISGNATIRDAQVKIDYLQTKYYIDKGSVKINNSIFDVSGDSIRDELNNIARVYGGIRHDRLRNFTLDFRVFGENILALNTEKKDNKSFYGYGVGYGDVYFTGNFQQTNLTVRAITRKGTQVSIPVNYDQSASKLSFIEFIKAGDTLKQNRKTLSGLNLDMELTLTEDAEVRLIFNERTGDIIKGRGNGDIQLNFSRTGEYTMYGNYEITSGQYTYTFLNLINKPFEINDGGRISWSGDPFSAQIDLDAVYKGATTAPYNFIEEYLNDETSKATARTATKVELLMHLEGILQKPKISFDMSFPDLTGEMKGYTDSKLRTLKSDENELNRQVFGLLVINGFLPSESALQGGALTTGGINTITEFLSNQLSIYLTDFLSNYIKGIDVDIGYGRYQYQTIDYSATGDEFSGRFSLPVFNDKASISGEIGVERSLIAGGASGIYVTGDFVIEYYISKDRRFKLRAYNSTDQVLEGRRTKTGVGLSYRREFDSLSDFFEASKSKSPKVQKSKSPKVPDS